MTNSYHLIFFILIFSPFWNFYWSFYACYILNFNEIVI